MSSPGRGTPAPSFVCPFVLALLATVGACGRSTGPTDTPYVGTVTTSSVDCATGASLGAETVETLDLVLEYRRDVDTYWLRDGEVCSVAFLPDDAAATSLTLYPGSLCEHSQPDGSRIRFAFTSGSMERSGNTITGEYDVRITSPPGEAAGCIDRHVTFTASQT